MAFQLDPAQYIVAGGTAAGFAFVVRLVTLYQSKITTAAFDRIDVLEADLENERLRCARLEMQVRDLTSELWPLKWELAALKRKYEKDEP